MVERTEDGWFFWNDNFTYFFGPFKSHSEAELYHQKYKAWVQNSNEEQTLERMNTWKNTWDKFPKSGK